MSASSRKAEAKAIATAIVRVVAADVAGEHQSVHSSRSFLLYYQQGPVDSTTKVYR
jgi:hypothetical protein